MNTRSLWRYVPPAGPVLSLLLIGLVMLSALLYYRAVKIQRFLEPALALSQPRNEFTKRINQIFRKEFGTDAVKGIMVKSSSIFLDKSLLFKQDGTVKDAAKNDLNKLAHVFLSLMKDNTARGDISIVLIISHYPSIGPHEAIAFYRMKAQLVTGYIQDFMFESEPDLRIYYPTFFVSAVQPFDFRERNIDMVEFRIVPSEFLHIKVLEALEKYSL
ncbi:MAG TPA: hypothetical protein VL122_12465 [Nitrospirota bacterium]|nr:hypothetical protein [Nitrospirota bacterium]